MKLTDKALRGLKPTGKRYEMADGGGLSVRVTPKGAVTFQFRYRYDGKQCRVDYGSYPHLSLADARKLHQKDKALLEKDKNPLEQKQAKKEERKTSPLVADLIEEFYKRYLLKNLRRPEQPYSYLVRDVKPELGKKRVKDIKRRDITRTLDKIVDRGSPVSANRALSAIKKMFQYALERGIIDNNPAWTISKMAAGGNEKPKERYLSLEEIKTFWTKLEDAPFSRQVGLTLKLLLLTGQRVSEVVNAELKEFDLQKRLWTIPATRTKNGLENKIHLTELTLSIIEELQALSADSVYLVASPKREKHPLRYQSIDRALKRHITHLEIENFTAHDLRRTLSTNLNSMKVSPWVIEKILNHKMQGVMAVYNLSEYLPEKKEALELWSNKILSILDDSKKILTFKKIG